MSKSVNKRSFMLLKLYLFLIKVSVRLMVVILGSTVHFVGLAGAYLSVVERKYDVF